MKAMDAANAIKPSTLRFKTPDFSATSSPSAARTSGVAVENAAASTNSRGCIDRSRCRHPVHAFNPMIYEHKNGEIEHHEESLKHHRRRAWNVRADQSVVAADINNRHEESCAYNTQGVETAEKSNNNSRIAISGR